MKKEKRFSKSLVIFGILGVVVFLLMISCIGGWLHLATPRVRIGSVKREIESLLPVGTPIIDVEQWLAKKSMPSLKFKTDKDEWGIKSFIPDTGSRGEQFTTTWVRDINIIFIFDGKGHLISYTAREEDRF